MCSLNIVEKQGCRSGSLSAKRIILSLLNTGHEIFPKEALGSLDLISLSDSSMPLPLTPPISGWLSEVYHKEWRKVSLIVSFFTQSNIFLLLPSTLAEMMVVHQEFIRQECFRRALWQSWYWKQWRPKKGKQEMCHAAVSTESEFFFVKVFSKKLKDKFTPSKIIMISKYYWHSCFLEVMLNFPGVWHWIWPDPCLKAYYQKRWWYPKVNKLQFQPQRTTCEWAVCSLGSFLYII